MQFSISFDYVPVFSKKQDIKPSNIEQTQHAGREGEQEKVSMCCLEATVCFSSAIDGQSVSAVIVRGLCDVCNNINAVTFVTDEQNARSLCPAEGPANLVAVRIPRLSVWHRQSHMYLRSSAPSDVYSDMYVKDAVLCRATQWEPWSTSVK
jgi:hypothetical protein